VFCNGVLCKIFSQFFNFMYNFFVYDIIVHDFGFMQRSKLHSFFKEHAGEAWHFKVRLKLLMRQTFICPVDFTSAGWF